MKNQINQMSSTGFTIVEIMIVLAVSGVMLVGAFYLISGQQQKTQFFQSTRNINQKIQDVINNVATGYYINANNYGCVAGVNGPRIIDPTSQTSDTRGTNVGCIFMGRAIQFSVKDQNSDNSQYNIYNLIGLQEKPGVLNDISNNVTNIQEASPQAAAPPNTTQNQDSTERDELQYGLTVKAMHYVDTSGNLSPGNIGTVAFTSLANPSAGSTLSGSQTVNVYPIADSSLASDSNSQVNKIRYVNGTDKGLVAAQSVIICFEGGIQQYGVITIGGAGRTTTTSLSVYNINDVLNNIQLNNIKQECT